MFLVIKEPNVPQAEFSVLLKLRNSKHDSFRLEPKCACLGMENFAFSDVEVFLVVLPIKISVPDIIHQ